MNNLENYYNQWMMPFGGYVSWPFFTAAIGLVLIWSLVWKGFALWKAATQNDKVWFVVLLLVNTAGILEILYLFVFSKKNGQAPQI